jgi:hypothetical protein
MIMENIGDLYLIIIWTNGFQSLQRFQLHLLQYLIIYLLYFIFCNKMWIGILNVCAILMSPCWKKSLYWWQATVLEIIKGNWRGQTLKWSQFFLSALLTHASFFDWKLKFLLTRLQLLHRVFGKCLILMM